ncbi:Aldolase-type TIM barrel [Penicillium vulpinum]|uniref:Dihydrodipicolinate synthase n=1 Tax=Penicillium vulpinum TaxID=29845 RepID=A0A1V6RTU9_9EURO|nr:Aldolase-type TIM barrel [Penicillium vulpinum]KAJ5971528.1 Aldolase-type TIM barrel [Penicillium vulpinum]OQE05197.1 hypothetical protein PENVUL_c026G00065 [Penicillium vulpinum]
MASTSTKINKSFPPGIHGPSITFFQDDQQQEIDWPTQERHLEYMITSGMHGIVLAGSSGESATLSVAEKSMLVKKSREIADRHGKSDFTISMGCLAGSTRDIMVQIQAAYESGADFALTLVPSIFHWAMTQKAITDFFEEIADRAPIPIVIYNFPNLLSGLDVNCDMLEKLGAHPNIAAVKLTCGGVGKASRVATQFEPAQFTSVSGMSDWLVAAFAAGSTGCISGVANIFPRVMVEIYDLYFAGKFAEATALQKKLVLPEWGIGTSDVSGMKWIISKERGYPLSSAHCRRPFPKFDDVEKQERVVRLVAPLLPVEEELKAKKV